MYSLKNLLHKEPVAVAAAVKSVLFAAVLLGAFAIDEAQLAGIAIAVELVFSLFVRNSVSPVE